MILTNCAACAAPLAHNAPRCVRCKLRYCDATCQHGPNAEITLRLRWGYASVLLHDDPSSEEDTREAVRVLEDVVRRVTQGYGEAHPLRKWTGETLDGARKHLALIEASK